MESISIVSHAGSTARTDLDANTWRGYALLFVVLAATAVISPMPFRGDASGHDFLFHLASWMDVAGQWREGIYYPRWAEWANWGFGEPRFVFYPPVSWLSGAALGSLLPWKMVPATLVWLTLIAAGMSMWQLARGWLSGPQAAAAAVLYAINPYHLVIVYYRSDFAELMAAAILPSLVWAVLRTVDNGWRGVPVFAFVFAAIWLTNAPAAVIATYAVVLIVAIACILRRAIRPAGPCAAGVALGFCLAAFYILPAAWEQRWVQIGRIISDELHPSENFLFTRANDPDFVAFNWKVSSVAVGLMVVTAVAIALSARKRKESRELWWIFAALGVASALLMFPVTAILWRHLPKLEFLQFPWRWLDAFDMAFAFFAAAALPFSQRRGASWLAFSILVAGIAAPGVAMARDAWWDTQGAPVLRGYIRSMRGYEGTDEYMPIGCDRSELPGNPDPTERAEDAPETPAASIEQVDPSSGEIAPLTDARVDIKSWTADRKRFLVQSSIPVTLALQLLDYPAWRARVDGNVMQLGAQPQTSQMLLSLPAGTHRVEIHFRKTWDRKAGDAISAITAFGLVIWVGGLRRRDGMTIKSGGDA